MGCADDEHLINILHSNVCLPCVGSNPLENVKQYSATTLERRRLDLDDTVIRARGYHRYNSDEGLPPQVDPQRGHFNNRRKLVRRQKIAAMLGTSLGYCRRAWVGDVEQDAGDT